MQQQKITEDHGFAPSFSIYSIDSITSNAIAKVIREEDKARFQHIGDVNDEEFEFEFALVLTDELKHSSSSKTKKSSSTGSKRWIFRYLLNRSEGKEAKKVDSPKHDKRIAGEVSKVGGRFKAQTPVHEQFYVQRRAENEVGKKKSYLPYRTDLVGFFANGNGIGRILAF